MSVLAGRTPRTRRRRLTRAARLLAVARRAASGSPSRPPRRRTRAHRGSRTPRASPRSAGRRVPIPASSSRPRSSTGWWVGRGPAIRRGSRCGTGATRWPCFPCGHPLVGAELAWHLNRSVTELTAPEPGSHTFRVSGTGGYAGAVTTVWPQGATTRLTNLYGANKVNRLEVRRGGDQSAAQRWLTVFDTGATPASTLRLVAAVDGSAGAMHGTRLTAPEATPSCSSPVAIRAPPSVATSATPSTRRRPRTTSCPTWRRTGVWTLPSMPGATSR